MASAAAQALAVAKKDARKPLIERRQQDVDRDSAHAPAKRAVRRRLSPQQQSFIRKVYFLHIRELFEWRTKSRRVVVEKRADGREVRRWDLTRPTDPLTARSAAKHLSQSSPTDRPFAFAARSAAIF